jgi:hypothetical protein
VVVASRWKSCGSRPASFSGPSTNPWSLRMNFQEAVRITNETKNGSRTRNR